VTAVTRTTSSSGGHGVWALLKRNSRAIRDALIIAGVLRAAWFFFVQGIQPWTFAGVDARAYWRIDLDHPYASSVLFQLSNYLYSPAFGHAVAPGSLLPFPAFFALWTGVSVVLLVWLARPWPPIVLILILPIVYEVCVGNVHFLLAAMVVVGFRYPVVWAFGLLTKITPGIGLIWFLVRREWQSLGLALAATGLVAGASFLIAPQAWFEWIQFLRANTGGGEALIARVIAGAAIVAGAAVLDRRALVPVGVWIAVPVVYINAWVILLAVVRLAADDAARERHPIALPLRQHRKASAA
jgi:hypothetical protein